MTGLLKSEKVFEADDKSKEKCVLEASLKTHGPKKEPDAESGRIIPKYRMTMHHLTALKERGYDIRRQFKREESALCRSYVGNVNRKVPKEIEDLISSAPSDLVDLKQFPVSWSSERVQRYNNCLTIFRTVDHPNMTLPYEFFKIDDLVFLSSEHADGQFLHRFMEQSQRFESDARDIFRQIASCMAYCHDRRITHFTLTPASIKIKSNPVPVATMIDFGVPPIFHASTSVFPVEKYYSYTPPELLKLERDTCNAVMKHTTRSANIYTLGVILYEMLTGQVPFTGTKEEVLDHIVEEHLDFYAFMSKDAILLLKKMLHPDPRKRPSAHDCLYHPWTEGEAEYSFIPLKPMYSVPEEQMNEKDVDSEVVITEVRRSSKKVTYSETVQVKYIPPKTQEEKDFCKKMSARISDRKKNNRANRAARHQAKAAKMIGPKEKDAEIDQKVAKENICDDKDAVDTEIDHKVAKEEISNEKKGAEDADVDHKVPKEEICNEKGDQGQEKFFKLAEKLLKGDVNYSGPKIVHIHLHQETKPDKTEDKDTQPESSTPVSHEHENVPTESEDEKNKKNYKDSFQQVSMDKMMEDEPNDENESTTTLPKPEEKVDSPSRHPLSLIEEALIHCSMVDDEMRTKKYITEYQTNLKDRLHMEEEKSIQVSENKITELGKGEGDVLLTKTPKVKDENLQDDIISSLKCVENTKLNRDLEEVGQIISNQHEIIANLAKLKTHLDGKTLKMGCESLKRAVMEAKRDELRSELANKKAIKDLKNEIDEITKSILEYSSKKSSLLQSAKKKLSSWFTNRKFKKVKKMKRELDELKKLSEDLATMKLEVNKQLGPDECTYSYSKPSPPRNEKLTSREKGIQVRDSSDATWVDEQISTNLINHATMEKMMGTHTENKCVQLDSEKIMDSKTTVRQESKEEQHNEVMNTAEKSEEARKVSLMESGDIDSDSSSEDIHAPSPARQFPKTFSLQLEKIDRMPPKSLANKERFTRDLPPKPKKSKTRNEHLPRQKTQNFEVKLERPTGEHFVRDLPQKQVKSRTRNEDLPRQETQNLEVNFEQPAEPLKPYMPMQNKTVSLANQIDELDIDNESFASIFTNLTKPKNMVPTGIVEASEKQEMSKVVQEEPYDANQQSMAPVDEFTSAFDDNLDGVPESDEPIEKEFISTIVHDEPNNASKMFMAIVDGSTTVSDDNKDRSPESEKTHKESISNANFESIPANNLEEKNDGPPTALAKSSIDDTKFDVVDEKEGKSSPKLEIETPAEREECQTHNAVDNRPFKMNEEIPVNDVEISPESPKADEDPSSFQELNVKVENGTDLNKVAASETKKMTNDSTIRDQLDSKDLLVQMFGEKAAEERKLRLDTLEQSNETDSAAVTTNKNGSEEISSDFLDIFAKMFGAKAANERYPTVEMKKDQKDCTIKDDPLLEQSNETDSAAVTTNKNGLEESSSDFQDIFAKMFGAKAAKERYPTVEMKKDQKDCTIKDDPLLHMFAQDSKAEATKNQGSDVKSAETESCTIKDDPLLQMFAQDSKARAAGIQGSDVKTAETESCTIKDDPLLQMFAQDSKARAAGIQGSDVKTAETESCTIKDDPLLHMFAQDSKARATKNQGSDVKTAETESCTIKDDPLLQMFAQDSKARATKNQGSDEKIVETESRMITDDPLLQMFAQDSKARAAKIQGSDEKAADKEPLNNATYHDQNADRGSRSLFAKLFGEKSAKERQVKEERQKNEEEEAQKAAEVAEAERKKMAKQKEIAFDVEQSQTHVPKAGRRSANLGMKCDDPFAENAKFFGLPPKESISDEEPIVYKEKEVVIGEEPIDNHVAKAGRRSGQGRDRNDDPFAENKKFFGLPTAQPANIPEPIVYKEKEVVIGEESLDNHVAKAGRRSGQGRDRNDDPFAENKKFFGLPSAQPTNIPEPIVYKEKEVVIGEESIDNHVAKAGRRSGQGSVRNDDPFAENKKFFGLPSAQPANIPEPIVYKEKEVVIGEESIDDHVAKAGRRSGQGRDRNDDPFAENKKFFGLPSAQPTNIPEPIVYKEKEVVIGEESLDNHVAKAGRRSGQGSVRNDDPFAGNKKFFGLPSAQPTNIPEPIVYKEKEVVIGEESIDNHVAKAGRRSGQGSVRSDDPFAENKKFFGLPSTQPTNIPEPIVYKEKEVVIGEESIDNHVAKAGRRSGPGSVRSDDPFAENKKFFGLSSAQPTNIPEPIVYKEKEVVIGEESIDNHVAKAGRRSGQGSVRNDDPFAENKKFFGLPSAQPTNIPEPVVYNEKEVVIGEESIDNHVAKAGRRSGQGRISTDDPFAESSNSFGPSTSQAMCKEEKIVIGEETANNRVPKAGRRSRGITEEDIFGSSNALSDAVSQQRKTNKPSWF